MKNEVLSYIVALGVIVSTLAWMSGVIFPYVAGKLMIFAIAMVVGLCVLAVRMWKTQMITLPSWITISFASFTTLATLSLLWSSNRAVSMWGSDGRGEGIFFLALLSVYSWLIDHLSSREKTRVSYAVVASSLIVSGYTLIGFIANSAHRSEGFHGNAILFAMYCYLVIVLGLTLFLQQQKKWVLVPTGFAMIALLASQTRGVILAGVAAIFLYIGVQILRGVSTRVKKMSAIAGIGMTVVVGGIIALNYYTPIIEERAPFLHRVVTLGGALDSDRQRLIIWETALQAIQQRPLLGYGSQMFYEAFDTQYDARLTRYGFSQVWSDRAHNVYLDIAVMYGLLGVVWYGSVLVYGIRKLKNTRCAVEYGVMGAGLGIAYLFEFTGVADMIVLILVLHLMNEEQVATKKITKEWGVIPVISLVLLIPVYTWYKTSSMVSLALTQSRGGDVETPLPLVMNSSIFQRDYLLRLADLVFRTIRNTPQDAEYAHQVAEALENYVQKNRNDVGMLVALGNVHLKSALTLSPSFTTLDAADAWYARASEIAPNKQTMYLQRANIALEKKDFEKVEKYFAQAYLLDKDNNTIEYQFGVMLLAIDRDYAAMDVLRAYYDRFATEKMIFVPNDEKELTNIAQQAFTIEHIDVMAYALANIVRNNEQNIVAKENLERALQSGQLSETTTQGIQKILNPNL